MCYTVWRYFVFLLLVFFKSWNKQAVLHSSWSPLCVTVLLVAQSRDRPDCGWFFDVWYQSDICRSFGNSLWVTVSMDFQTALGHVYSPSHAKYQILSRVLQAPEQVVSCNLRFCRRWVTILRVSVTYMLTIMTDVMSCLWVAAHGPSETWCT